MRWGGLLLVILLLGLSPSWGDDKPKEDKKEQTAKDRYQALLKDFEDQRRDILAEARKVTGAEQQKLFAKYSGLGREYAEKFYKLAEDEPKDPVAVEALFWVMQNGEGSPVFTKASDKVTVLIGEMPLKDLTARLNTVRAGTPALIGAVLKRAEKDEKETQSGDLVAWAATNGYVYPEGRKAITLLVEKYPNHMAVERLCQLLGQRPSPEGEAALQQILERSAKPKVKAAAAFALGQARVAKHDRMGDKPAEAEKVAAEAEKYMAQAIELYGKDNASQVKAVERELNMFRTLRVGKEAPEITAPDLDGKDFKLSDYRGKVILLDFWGNW